jgi:mRNA interferase RelE/StbE
MNVEIRQSFVKDTLRLPVKIQHEIAATITAMEVAEKLSALKACKKLTGYKTAYRIRLGNYRIGFIFEKNTIELVRALARKDMYKYFP